jgi:hypothetical protein
MIHSDYIMRMTAMLAAVLSRVMFHKNSQAFPLAITEIDQAGRTLVGIDRGMVRLFSAGQLMALFGNDRTVAVPKAYVLGALLAAEAGVLDLQGEAGEAAAIRTKALHLLLATFVEGEGPIDEDHQDRIDRCLREWGDGAVPIPELDLLVRQLEMGGRYSRAEDRLFELLELDPGHLPFGKAFYDRLRSRTDAELVAGGLSRDEVERGRAELDRYPHV